MSTELAIVGVAQQVDKEDMLIPRLLLVQKMSKAVDELGAKEGDIIDSVDGTKLGDSKDAVEVIVFAMFKTWVVMEDGKFKRIEPFTFENSDYQFSENINGVEVQRNLTYNYYGLLATDAANGIPYVLSMTRTSSTTARKLNTTFAREGRRGVPSFGKVVKLKSTKKKNDNGSWVAYDFEMGRDTTDEERKVAEQWAREFVGSKDKFQSSEDGLPF